MCSFILFGISTLFTVYLALGYENAEFMLLVYLQVVLLIQAVPMVLLRFTTVRGRIEIPVGISDPGKETLIKLVISNKGPFAVKRMKALVIVEDLCTGKKKKKWMRIPKVPKGETSFTRMVSFDGAGNYMLRLKKLRVYDFSGVMSGSIRIKSTAELQVMPELFDMPVRLSLPVRNFYGESDVYDENRPGHDSSEIFQVREYRKGDRLQNIHWKLTAKQDDVMVKENALPKACPVILFLDFGEKRKKKKRAALVPFLTAAASISFSMMDAGCPHYVVWYDDVTQDIVRVRVTEEESFFEFLGSLMRVNWRKPKEELMARYQERYRSELYVWRVSLSDDLELKKESEVLAKLSAKNPGESFASLELVL